MNASFGKLLAIELALLIHFPIISVILRGNSNLDIMKKYYIFIIFILASCVNENYKQELMKDSYIGIIQEEYNDIKNHNALTYKIDVKNKKIERIVEFYPNISNYADIGDSIIKIGGELKITIKKKNGMASSFFYE